MQKRYRWYKWGAFIGAGVIVGLSIAQAIRDHSWQPVWDVAVVPAVLWASFGMPRTRRCWPRSRHRSDA